MGRKRKRALVAVLAVATVVVVAGVGALASVTAAGQPPLSGTQSVPGLGADATIARDVNGITQISASTPHDLFFAQGWVHASERLWQMEVWRRVGAGRLAEMFARASAETRTSSSATLDWRGAAERDYAALSDDAKAVLEAYSRRRQRLHRRPPGPVRPRVHDRGRQDRPGQPADGLPAGAVDRRSTC